MGSDSLIGGPGLDTINYSNSLGGIYVSLLDGIGKGYEAEGDTI